MVLVEGAAGMGKTALLKQLETLSRLEAAVAALSPGESAGHDQKQDARSKLNDLEV